MKHNDRLSILLIQPPLPANRRHKKVLPLGLGYLASYLRCKVADINVEILDALVLDLNYPAVFKEIAKARRDIIGITFWTAQAPFAYALGKALKQRYPDTIVIFGGVHVTCCPEEATEFADYCVLHEGERTFCELIECIRDNESPEKILGIAYKRGEEFIRTPARPFIDDLDEIPFPAWDLLPLESYTTPLHVVGGRRMPIIGSRGCPYHCSFCSSPYIWKQQVRWRSPENVVEEMKEIIQRYGIRQFHFWDDNLLMNKEYINGLCNSIIRNALDIRWVGITRGSHVTAYPQILGLLKESGCIGLEIGIESADSKTFLNINKEEDLKELQNACNLQRAHGLYPLFTYMSLNPGENITTYYLQAQFIDSLLAGLPWYKFFHPLPLPVYIGQFCTPHVGTELYKNAKNLGTVLAQGWEEYNHHTINFVPDSLLDDIPEKTTQRLRESDCIICTEAAWSWMYELNPDDGPVLIQLAKRYAFFRFLTAFFNHCNGDMKLRDIAKTLSGALGISLKKSIQYSVMITIVLSQLGVIRSLRYSQGIDIKLKDISIPDDFQPKREYRLLKMFSSLPRHKEKTAVTECAGKSLEGE